MLSVVGKGYSMNKSENPFYVEPPAKAFYHPSRKKHLSKKEKQISLSPDRPTRDATTTLHLEDKVEDAFLAGSHSIQTLNWSPKPAVQSPSSSNFDESWPDSERPSSPSFINTPGTHTETGFVQADRPDPLNTADPFYVTSNTMVSNRREEAAAHPKTSSKELPLKQNNTPSSTKAAQSKTSSKELPLKQTSIFSAPKAAYSNKEKSQKNPVDNDSGSVLQRYIERFRHGTPMSREERLQQEGDKKKEFWWLDSGLPSPNSTSTPKDSEGRSRPFTTQIPVALTVEKLKQRDQLDDDTNDLQKKADRLLLSAQSVSSSEPIVSTDGLGSTGSDISSFFEAPVRPTFIPRKGAADTYHKSSNKLLPRKPGTKRSENDILYQWRLQRKMEEAKQNNPVISKSIVLEKTHLEQDAANRLATFREKLLQRPSVATLEVTAAKVEKAVKETQTSRDTAVQTSPRQQQAFSEEHSSQQPCWSYSRKTDTSIQANDQDFPEFFTDETLISKANLTTDARNNKQLQQKGSSGSVSENMLNNQYLLESDYQHKKSDSEDKMTDKVSSKEFSTSQQRDSCHGTAAAGNTKYRQFLTAEKPHVHDGGDSPQVKRQLGLLHHHSSTSSRRKTNQEMVEEESVFLNSEMSGQEKAILVMPNQAGDSTGVEVNKSTGLKTTGRKKGKNAPFLSHGCHDSVAGRYNDNSDCLKQEPSASVLPSEISTEGMCSEKITRREGSRDRLSTREKQFIRERNSEKRKSNIEILSSEKPTEKNLNSQKCREGRPVMQQSSRSQRSQGCEVSSLRVVPTPQKSSSPSRIPLTSAIGQVINERLFDMSGSLISSVESASSVLHQNARSPCPHDQFSNTNINTDSEYESDGDFASDPLLQVLRQQRHQYELQLRYLDSHLSQ